MEDKIFIRKNILDIDMQKYLQIASVSIIIGFTYFVGIIIAILTHQINWESFVDVAILGILSVLVLGLVSFFSFNSIMKIKRITRAIREIDKSA
tara:strand:+ start:179 stop:460 length:282 start_codon:yes stop_codon:yes gene_type:complete